MGHRRLIGDVRHLSTLYLILIASGAVVVAALVAVGFFWVKAQVERTTALETKLGVAVVPFFKHMLVVLAPEVTHPHKKYAPLDELVAEALLEPEVRMSDKRLALMDELLDKRALDTSSDMRPGENQKALIVKQLVHLIRMEGDSDVPLTGFTVVGSQKTETQTGELSEKE